MKPNRRIIQRAMIVMALLLGLAVPAAARQAPADVLGLYPGMSDLEVQQRLRKIGEVVRGQDKLKQTWKLKDARYEYLVLRYDEDWKMHWVTVFAREGGKRVRYRDVGELAQATHTGQHFYTWTIPAHPGVGSWSVVARGDDPKYLGSISISRAMRQDLIGHERKAAAVDTGEDDD